MTNWEELKWRGLVKDVAGDDIADKIHHTLIIVDEGANLHFIEGCSAPKYNVANLHAGGQSHQRQIYF